jgi:ribosomal protein S18 acetylase RimI-like enzyme
MNVAERVQASIRAVNAADRETVVVGPFALYRSRASDHPYLNYAVPADGATEWEAIDDLREAFAARGLQPRLEFVAERAPGLEQALAAHDFALQARIPVMTCPEEHLREVPAPTGVVIGRVFEGADVRPLLEVQAAAFGEGPPSDEAVQAYRGRGVLARAEGVPAGAASHTAIAEGVSEIGGVGVLERFRRRGIAAALTSAVAAQAFAEGAELCFLTPGDDGAERVYGRAGFARAGTTMVHMVG